VFSEQYFSYDLLEENIVFAHHADPTLSLDCVVHFDFVLLGEACPPKSHNRYKVYGSR
jgi:hypothetical protein